LLAASKGAPVEWVPMDLVPTNVAVPRSPLTRPSTRRFTHGGFSFEPEGQKVLEKYYYGSGAKDYGFKKWRPEHGLTTEQYEKELIAWDKLLHAITRK
jgi:hypothetical protein